MSAEFAQRLEALLASGKETAMLRYSLGKSYLDAGNVLVARTHLERAVELDPHYSVGWKLLGRAYLELDDRTGAREAWSKGLGCAQARGDAQVVKELGVFLRRLDKAPE
ncbi:tetratricopeptide repeat protein [Diaphorobacter sp.]|uniref:tetratricopeptide repeat protein n=1 Tax=Diaphorobacter sp. TaxID=1934310 RepID=UPI0028AE59D4|nr:tetratricopeptide repeat protein [Diaphorobacter sp.]